MSESAHTENEADVQQVSMRRTETVSGEVADKGRRFTVTDALSAAGYTNEMVKENDLYVHFNQQPGGGLVGAVVRDQDIPDGMYHEYHKIFHAPYSFRIYFTHEQLNGYGFESDEDGDRPVIFDTWGGSGAIALLPMDIRQIIVERELNHPLEALPKRMRDDYLAVEKEGYTPRELAEEYAKEMESSVSNIEWNIERNVEEADRRLNEYEQN